MSHTRITQPARQMSALEKNLLGVSAAQAPRLLPGLLGLALSNGLCRGCISTSLGRAANMAFMEVKWSFKKPIFIGDTIHIRQSVREKKETKNKEKGILVLTVSVLNQNSEVVQEGTKTYMLQRRGRRSSPPQS